MILRVHLLRPLQHVFGLLTGSMAVARHCGERGLDSRLARIRNEQSIWQAVPSVRETFCNSGRVAAAAGSAA